MDVSLSVDNRRFTLGTMTALTIDERFHAKTGEEFRREMKSCWNPKNPKQNAWREYIDGVDS